MGKIFKAMMKSGGLKKETGEDAVPPPRKEREVIPGLPAQRKKSSMPQPGKGRAETGRKQAGTQFMNLDSTIVAYYKPHSQESEQFRLLKTSIQFPEKGEPPRTIMVTSTVPGEGKSFIAANLAVSLAMSIDEYVLLMDCDLRRPSIHRLFGFAEDTPGLSEYLGKNVPLSDILLKTDINKLTLIPCGIPPANPYELLSSEQMRTLIQEAKARYSDRYIIIDSPPPYITAEANALARQVDAIVIVIKAGKTRKDALQDMVDTYGKRKILGVVKNFAEKPLGKKYQHAYGYGDD